MNLAHSLTRPFFSLKQSKAQEAYKSHITKTVTKQKTKILLNKTINDETFAG